MFYTTKTEKRTKYLSLYFSVCERLTRQTDDTKQGSVTQDKHINQAEIPALHVL